MNKYIISVNVGLDPTINHKDIDGWKDIEDSNTILKEIISYLTEKDFLIDHLTFSI